MVALFLISATIIFTYGYEGVISSFLTVQPPVIIYKKLKDLLLANYKILINELQDPVTLIPVFKTENITETLKSSIVVISQDLELLASKLFLARTCNTTLLINYDGQKECKILLKKAFPDIFCYSVTETVVSRDEIFNFFGVYHIVFSKIVDSFISSGILSWYYKIEVYKRKRWISPQDIGALEYEEYKERPFTMKDWRILRIFIAWTGLLLSTLAVLVAEKLFTIIQKLWVRISAFYSKMFSNQITCQGFCYK